MENNFSNGSYHNLSADALQASDVAGKAAEIFNHVQDKTIEDTVLGLQHLAYISAGTISLSITFLGPLLWQDINISQKIFQDPFIFGVTVIEVLYVSWSFLFIAVIVGLLYRLINAKYLRAAATSHWAGKSALMENKKLRYIHADLPFQFTGGAVQNRDEGVTRLADSERLYIRVMETAKKSEKYYLRLAQFAKYTTVYSFIVGMIFLLIFAVVCVEMISVVRLSMERLA